MPIIKSFVIHSLWLMMFWGCQNKAVVYEGTKLKGVCFVAPSQVVGVDIYEPIKKLNAEWVAITPYGFTRDGNPDFMYNKNSEGRWWGESPKGASACIRMAHQQGLKVMLKPHAWVQSSKSSYTGDLDFKTEKEWQTFEKTFGEYVLDFAHVADSTQVEMYCIATEFKTFVAKRPQFWFKLISDVKKVYKGKLTYAENWDCYEKVPFWRELDFVGVDAYFPLSDEKSPTIETLKKGWEDHLDEIEAYSGAIQKPILFTEIGYQSTDFSTHKPWASHSKEPDNHELQGGAYQAFFERVWKEKWFAGCFIWKWFPEIKEKKSLEKNMSFEINIRHKEKWERKLSGLIS